MERFVIRSIDFETTGEPLPYGDNGPPSRICEAGFTDILVEIEDIPAEGDQPAKRKIKAEIEGPPWSTLVNPLMPMPPEAQSVHHISDDMLADAPTSEAMGLALMNDPPRYFCAHNAKFEKAFWGGGDIPFLCTYNIGLRLWPDAEKHSLQYLRYGLPELRLDQDLGLPPHRAGPDCYVGAALMVACLEHPNFPDFERALIWSNGQPLLPKVNFGKHKGAKWADLPTDYLRWLIDKSDMGKDVKANAKYWLRERGA